MHPDEFIEPVYLAVYKTTIDGVLRLLAKPPGREPYEDLADLAAWYNSLDDRGREKVAGIVRVTTDQAVFGMLASIDGVRSLGRGIEVTLQSGDVVLNADHDLHEGFRHRVDFELR
jgi:hypothetical protein